VHVCVSWCSRELEDLASQVERERRALAEGRDKRIAADADLARALEEARYN
jgi:hypothetical protein